MEERCDIAIRIGKLQDSTLKVRKLADSKMILVASPSYLKQHGKPKYSSELNKFQCLNFYAHPSLNDWPFNEIGTQKKFQAKSFFLLTMVKAFVKWPFLAGELHAFLLL